MLPRRSETVEVTAKWRVSASQNMTLLYSRSVSILYPSFRPFFVATFCACMYGFDCFVCQHKAFTLEAINLRVEPGELIGVVGSVGSSKSSLLMAVLREIVPETLSAVGSGANGVSGGMFTLRVLFARPNV